MKKYILILLVLISQQSFAQTGNWPANGAFTYFGTTDLAQTNPANYAVLQDKSNGVTFLNSPLEVRFRVANDDKMILSSDGNFGIGTTSPEAKLDVNGNISVAHFGSVSSNRSEYNNYTNLFLGGGITDQGNGTFKIITDGASNYFAGIKMDRSGGNVGAIKFYSGTSISGTSYTLTDSELENYARMTIVNGKVGIGTTTPDQKLTVMGNLTMESGDNPVLYSGTGTYELNRFFQLINSTGHGTATGLKAGGVLVADSYTYANPSKNDLIVKGNVGIGTTSPNQKLTVNGTIYGKEVKVDLSVPGPDYVFEESYALPSLQAVQSYIDENKHLPEVPSAKEMEMNGINLSEMNMLLLKKVEELTLYILRQEERIKNLESKVK